MYWTNQASCLSVLSTSQIQVKFLEISTTYPSMNHRSKIKDKISPVKMFLSGRQAGYSNRQQRLKQQESLSEYKCDKCEVSGGYHILTGLQDTSKTYNDHSQYKPNVKVCLYMYMFATLPQPIGQKHENVFFFI